MAIKNKTISTPQPIPIPSQEEIKSSSVSFSEQELKELRSLKEKISKLAFDFGNLTINKIKLEENEAFLKKELNNLENQEKTLAQNLTEKYGNGKIDLDSGTFTPST